MASFLLDTHAWSWNMTGDPRLPARTLKLMEEADAIFLSPVSVYEIAQKVRLGKWPEMAPVVDRLDLLVEEQNGSFITLTPEIALLAATMTWHHRDPFDRMIAATAIKTKIKLISADTIFDDLSDRKDWPGRVW
jgi:PIN domain nuclease of toxin-antitoxin system